LILSNLFNHSRSQEWVVDQDSLVVWGAFEWQSSTIAWHLI
jgi:hypothetical protein